MGVSGRFPGVSKDLGSACKAIKGVLQERFKGVSGTIWGASKGFRGFGSIPWDFRSVLWWFQVVLGVLSSLRSMSENFRGAPKCFMVLENFKRLGHFNGFEGCFRAFQMVS